MSKVYCGVRLGITKHHARNKMETKKQTTKQKQLLVGMSELKTLIRRMKEEKKSVVFLKIDLLKTSYSLDPFQELE